MLIIVFDITFGQPASMRLLSVVKQLDLMI